MSSNTHPVRRCAPCDADWPNNKAYNLCPRCQRCTFATTAAEYPDAKEAKEKLLRYERVRAFDEACDARHAERDAAERAKWDAEMDALFDLTPTIPDPDPYPGLMNPQHVDFWHGLDGRGDA